MAAVSSDSSSESEEENNQKPEAKASGSTNPFANMIDPDFDMSKVPETEDIRIEQYFSKEELAELSNIEMTRYRNMKRNYDVMRMLGLPGKKPYFMERNRRSLVQPKEPPTPPLTSSEEEEDEEWTPELERKKNQRPKKPWFLLPPKKPRVAKPKTPSSHKKGKKKAEATVSKAPTTSDDKAEPFPGFQAEEVAEMKSATAASLAELEEKMKALELEIQKQEAVGPWDKHESGSESDYSTELELEPVTAPLQPEKLQVLEKEAVQEKEEIRTSRYPQRNIPRKNYKEVEIPDDDHFLYCEDCNELYEGDCPVHGPLTVVKDKQIPKGEPNRAARTLPDNLSVRPSKIRGAGDGVWLDGQAMAKNLVFGPYDGKITGPEIGLTTGYAWQISKNDKVKYYIDASDVTKSSWMRYVNCARNEEEQNMVAFQYYRNIYYRTYKPVPPGTELLVWYGNEYAKELGISEKAQAKVEEARNQQKSGVQTGAVAGYSCSRCGKLFSTQDYLDRHVKKHPDMSGAKRLKCKHCNYSTDITVDIKKHMVTHTGERPFKCSTCRKRFTTNSSLRRHERVHTGEKPYRCEECGKSFDRQYSLTTHMLTHSGLQPFACTHCGKGFAHTGSLQNHMRIHTGEKPYKCEHCEMAFTERGHLKRHVISIHTKEFPHRCQVCHKGFLTPGELRTHVQKEHSK
ncbi:Histone-lysine N-methyltransferase prdm9 [Branchiostoma belcheri]|nr:Histone-lysine N-methyltransferase prdm9 [Branchiostoma belcheri]